MISVEELYALYKKCAGITTDSRNIKDGVMFFALKGEKFDGNDFALEALKSGARYAVVDRFLLEGTAYRGRKCVVVENSLEMLQKLAAYHRKQIDIPVVGITGTNGKTTTKELVAAVLARKYNLVATQDNFNNHIGVPLTLFRLDERTEMAVVEMGASAPGEIAELTKIVQPTCGLITTVGKAHCRDSDPSKGSRKRKENSMMSCASGAAPFFTMRTTKTCAKWFPTGRACAPANTASKSKASRSFLRRPNRLTCGSKWRRTANRLPLPPTWSGPTMPTM